MHNEQLCVRISLILLLIVLIIPTLRKHVFLLFLFNISSLPILVCMYVLIKYKVINVVNKVHKCVIIICTTATCVNTFLYIDYCAIENPEFLLHSLINNMFVTNICYICWCYYNSSAVLLIKMLNIFLVMIIMYVNVYMFIEIIINYDFYTEMCEMIINEIGL